MSEDQTSPPLPPQNPVIHNAALAGAIIAPLAMLLPPRKLDIRFFVLSGAFSLSTNQLAYEYTGESIYARFQKRVDSVTNVGLPEAAQRTQRLLKEQKERDAALGAAKADENKGLKRIVKDTWMGGEGEDWSEKRSEEHKKSIEEGKGISGIILDQISDVWGSLRSEKKSNDDASPPDSKPSEKR